MSERVGNGETPGPETTEFALEEELEPAAPAPDVVAFGEDWLGARPCTPLAGDTVLFDGVKPLDGSVTVTPLVVGSGLTVTEPPTGPAGVGA